MHPSIDVRGTSFNILCMCNMRNESVYSALEWISKQRACARVCVCVLWVHCICVFMYLIWMDVSVCLRYISEYDAVECDACGLAEMKFSTDSNHEIARALASCYIDIIDVILLLIRSLACFLNHFVYVVVVLCEWVFFCVCVVVVAAVYFILLWTEVSLFGELSLSTKRK